MISQPNTGFVSCSFLSSMYFECYGKSGTRAIQEASPIAVIKEKKNEILQMFIRVFHLHTQPCKNGFKLASGKDSNRRGATFLFQFSASTTLKKKRKSVCIKKKKRHKRSLIILHHS